MNAAIEILADPTLDGRADFDFLFGAWRVDHRRLKRRGAGAGDDWDCFSGTHICRPALDGLCNVEEHDMSARGLQGLALRTFDIVRRTWAIYWVSSADGLLGEPVFGRFEGGEGRFYGVDLDASRPVKVMATPFPL